MEKNIHIEDLQIRPLISYVQKIALYETKNKFFVVGSNNNESKFRIIRIDRSVPRKLILKEDNMEYDEKEVLHALLNAIKAKNPTATLPKPIQAFGIIGFIRFLEGYYMILITKRRHVASIGLHVIYKVEDTAMIYIPHDTHRTPHSDETRYVKLFQSVDLSSNFYFSYSYDLTHSYQMNTLEPTIQKSAKEKDYKQNEILDYTNSICGLRYAPNQKFVWNTFLLSHVEKNLSFEWVLHIVHGFIGQSNVSVFGRSIYVTLIARRSNTYAGTRFLKRGADSKGNVANEVETEQMIIDVGLSSHGKMRVSSFIQMRGSVPSQWSQEITKMVTKPAITFDVADPFYEIAGAHFNELFHRYGSPIIILNLVKTREKKKHESQLSEHFHSTVSYLNLFLQPSNRIQYISFDMARKNKRKEAVVMDKLAEIAKNEIHKIGFFVKNGPLVDNKVMENINPINNLQKGVIRVNCVDCLDRTNTAQFALGKCALGYQLYFLGLIDKPELEFDSDCVRLLERLYEDHGDTLALQYGGSQLVHRIKTYRKTAPWTSQGNDIMQTFSRYYRNTFSDSEKQQAINLFLGLYQPDKNKEALWEQINDYYLHHPEAIDTKHLLRKNPLTEWCDAKILECLPFSYDYLKRNYLVIIPELSLNSENIDLYHHYHKTNKITIMSECFEFQIPHSVRDFMSHFVTNFSPFTVRIRHGKCAGSNEKMNKVEKIQNPSLTGKSSTSSNTSTTSSESDDDDDITPISPICDLEPSLEIEEFDEYKNEEVTDVYTLQNENVVSDMDKQLYKNYLKVGKFSSGQWKMQSINECLTGTSYISQLIPRSTVEEQELGNNYLNYLERQLLVSVSDDNIIKYKRYCLKTC